MTPRVAPEITVIICTRDRPALLGQCLRALSVQNYSAFDVLVVDNSRNEDSVQLAQEHASRWGASYTFVHLPGLTRARNVGARLARGEIIAYLDDDAVAESTWLRTLAADFLDPEIGAVTGRILSMKAREDSREMTDETSVHQVLRTRGTFDRSLSDWFVTAAFGGVGDGGNMAFRRRIVAEVQPFDERLGSGRMLAGGDEHSLFAALLARGYRITHNPDAIVRHPSPSTPELQQARRYDDVRSAVAYLLFTWRENPAHRIDLIRFLARAVWRRALGVPGAHHPAARLSRARMFIAIASGISLYWRAREELKWSGRASPDETRGVFTDDLGPRAAVR